MSYCIYLRKSRADAEAESRGEGETLARHEAELLRTANRLNLTVTAIYKEIVSGDTISARPVMQQLLTEVEQNVWQGVLVMEVERLARGDTIDQGIVAQAFKFSDTKIITPIKTYDPSNEYDEEYFEFGLFMSRREYKTINRRLQRGRVASINEGKYVGNKTPYGYQRVKLQGQKGWTLEPDADTEQNVRLIFEWYSIGLSKDGGPPQRLGAALIVRRLNDMGISSPTGASWTESSVKQLLSNPVYAGWVRWGARAAIKKVEDGVVKTSRPRAKPEDIHLVKGLHTPLITQDTFDLAQSIMNSHGARPNPREMAIKNPLAGLVKCGLCSRNMVRRPYGNSGYAPTLMCHYTSCKTVASDLRTVEAAVLEALENWYKDLLTSDKSLSTANTGELEALKKSLTALDKELEQLKQQELKAFQLVETNVYNIETFLSRSRYINDQREALTERKKALEAEIQNQMNLRNSRQEIIPMVKHVLDCYWDASDPAIQNELLKSVLEKVVYNKSQSMRWIGTADGDMTLTLYPKLPQL